MNARIPERETTRTAVLWVPDWPVVAAMCAQDIPFHAPAAIHDGRQIIAVSASARSQGVRRGMRRRRATECCPDLVFCPIDEGRDTRWFEPVALAAETVVAGLEIARPGLILLPASGASSYHGSDAELMETLVSTIAQDTGHESQVGVADGLLAAVLASRASIAIPPRQSAAYLRPQPAAVLLHAAMTTETTRATADLISLLDRLGVRTVGAFADMPAHLVTARFGELGTWAHRLACGQDLRPPARRRIEPDIAVGTDLDPPVERLDMAAFAARSLAEELHARLVSASVTAGKVRITARTDAGELERTWRGGSLSPARITDRVRWQLEGWLTAARIGPGMLTYLGLTAEEVVPAGAEQPRLWGASSGEDARAHRALGRVQGLLGGDAVLTTSLQGGRDARERVHLIPFGEEVPMARDPHLPWPGALPSPAPATLLAQPSAAAVWDRGGQPLDIDALLLGGGQHTSGGMGRGDGIPAVVHWDQGRHTIRDWAGPWPVAGRWWTPRPVHRVHLQVVLDDGRGLLLRHTDTGWAVEGIYD